MCFIGMRAATAWRGAIYTNMKIEQAMLLTATVGGAAGYTGLCMGA
jgi:hypothetical protein